MSKVIRRAFSVFNYDKEEQWLNEMADQGLALTDVSPFTYYFKESAPGEYQVRMQFLEKKAEHQETQDYIRFLEDTGIEYIGDMFGWAYFRKVRGEGSFELYSDTAPKVKQINRIMFTQIIFFVLNLWMSIENFDLYFTREKVPTRLVIAILTSVFTIVLGMGLWKMYTKKRELKKKDNLFE